MKYIAIILFTLIGLGSKAQLPWNTTPTQYSTGYFRQGWHRSDSGNILASRPPSFTPRYGGTIFMYPNAGVDTSIIYWTGDRFIKLIPGFDSTSISNRINLKLNITDTTSKWWGLGKRWVDTVYRVNDSTIGFTINNGAQQTFQILGRSPSGGGGSGLTSVGLSMPSAFTVTNSPLTSNGTLNVTMPGLSTQYVRANGTVATTDTSMIPNFYLKVRGLFSGTTPITVNQTTGIVNITNANTTGTKGAATFNNSDFTDNGAGLISLRNPSGGGGVDTMFRTEGIDSTYFTINGNQYAIKDSTGGVSNNISNASLTADGNYSQNWSNKQWYVDSISGQFLFRMGGIGSTGTRRKEFRINWGGSAFGDQIDGYNMFATIKKADLSNDSLRLGFSSSGTGVLSMGYYDVANASNNSFISYSAASGLININAKDSIWIKGAVPAASADSILGVRFVSGTGLSKIVKIPLTAAGGGGATQGIQSVLTVSNIDTNRTFQFGYAQAGFTQSQQDTPTDTTWSGEPIYLYPYRSSDTAVYNPRLWRLFKTRTHRYDLAVPYANSIFTVAEFGSEAVGQPYLQFGDIEQNWYDNYEVHPVKMKLIGSGSAIRMQSVTMNRTSGLSTWTQRATQHIFSDISDNQMLALNRTQSTMTGSGTTQPSLRFLLQSTDGSNGGLTMAQESGQCIYNWHPSSGAFQVATFDLPYQWIAGTSRSVNSSDAEYDFRFANRLKNNRMMTFKNGTAFMMVMETDADSFMSTTIGGNHFMQNGSFSLMAKSLRNKKQKQFAIGIASNAADTFYYKVPFATDSVGRIAVNVPDPNNAVKDGLLGLTETEDFRIYGKSIIVDNTAGVNRLLTLKNTDAGNFSGSDLHFFSNTGTSSTNGYSHQFFSNGTSAPYANAYVQRNFEGGPHVWFGSSAELGRFNDAGELQIGSTTDLGTAKLQVTGTIQMQDGNQGSGKVLMSDANGIGTWQSVSGTTTIYTGDGTLGSDRNVASGGFTLRLTGTNNSDTLLSIVNSGTSSVGMYSIGSLFGVDAQSSNVGLRAFGNGTGLLATGDANEGAVIKSNTIRGATIQSVPTSTNTVQEVVRLERGVNGSPGANGVGGSADFYNKLSDNSSQASNQLISKWTNATVGSRGSQFSITGVNNTTTGTILTIDGDSTITTYGRRKIAVTVSSAGTLSIGNSESYVFSGTTTTWTLPAVSGNEKVIYYIKNRGSGNITLNSNAGGNDIYDTAATNTITIAAGAGRILINDGSFWSVQ